MSALRLSASVLLASLLVLATAAASYQAAKKPGDFSANVSITLLPDLTPQPVSSFAAKRAEEIAARLASGLTPEMRQNFDLFLYVSKAGFGPLAQRMFVFRKQSDGSLKLAYDWAASTGREQIEVNFRGRKVITATPGGYYQLDPRRMYSNYRSASWNQNMPSSMFFDREQRGIQTGLAIHAASDGDIAKLGSRASAGCVHLAPQDAALLYEMVRDGYRGQVPRFAYDEKTGTRSNAGDFLRDHFGQLKMTEGYRVLIRIEDYGGEDPLTALL